jgi:amino acid permease
MCTLGITIFSFISALFIPTIGDVLSVSGATINTAIGFLFPIVFYLKLEEKKGGKFTNEKCTLYILFVFICICSIIELYSFIDNKLNKNQEDN